MLTQPVSGFQSGSPLKVFIPVHSGLLLVGALTLIVFLLDVDAVDADCTVQLNSALYNKCFSSHYKDFSVYTLCALTPQIGVL